MSLVATSSYIYRCSKCDGLQGVCVIDLNSTMLMRSALTFKRDAEKRGKTVEVMAVSDVRVADWCKGACRNAVQQPSLLEAQA
jgi:hypothetical protein